MPSHVCNRIHVLGAAFLVALTVGGSGAALAQAKRVGLVYTAPHELINQVVKGFRDELDKQMPPGSYEIVERNASGDTTQYSSTVDSVLAQGLSLIAPITTPISQIALQNKPKTVPMVFLAVTDPLGAHLVDSIEQPGKSTGVSDLAPFEAILKFIKQTRPDIRRIGLPYSPEEQPAIYGRDQIIRLAPSLGFVIDAKAVTSKDELAVLLSTMAQNDDAILVGSDNGMFEAAPLIVKTAMDAKKPVFAGDSTSIKAGAVGGYTIDYTQVGKEGARLAARVLQGESAGQIPVVVMRDGVLEINRDSAARLGIKFPPDVIAKAKTIYPK